MDFLRSLLNFFRERRYVRALLERMARDDSLRALFPLDRLSIYRVPVPDGGATLRYDLIEETWRVSPQERLYVVDSEPLGMFTKPTAFAVFPAGSNEPALFVTGQWRLYLDEAAVPFFDTGLLRKRVVHNPQPLILADEGGAIILKGKKKDKEGKGETVEKGPIGGPFPPDDPPEPGDNDPEPPNPPLSAPDPHACKPRLLFFGVCCEASLVEKFIWDETQKVTKAFADRGYETAEARAGSKAPDGSTPNSFDEMMTWLKNAIAEKAGKDPKFCTCPADELVIWIGAHGNKAQFQWKTFLEPPASVDYTHLMQRLLEIPEIKGNPKKVYLILLACRSGTLWDDGVIPRDLTGMHLISSAPDSKTNSYGGSFSNWIAEAVKKARNWTHLIKILKYLHHHHKGDKSRPKSGDIAGCFAKIRLAQIRYGGDDIGALTGYGADVNGVNKSGNVTINKGGSTPPDKILIEGFFGACGPGKSVEITVEAGIQLSSTTSMSVPKTDTINFDCDNKNHSGSIAVDVKSGSQTATINFDIDITSSC